MFSLKFLALHYPRIALLPKKRKNKLRKCRTSAAAILVPRFPLSNVAMIWPCCCLKHFDMAISKKLDIQKGIARCWRCKAGVRSAQLLKARRQKSKYCQLLKIGGKHDMTAWHGRESNCCQIENVIWLCNSVFVITCDKSVKMLEEKKSVWHSIV